MAEPGQHAANLAVLSFGQDKLEHVGLALAAQESGPFGADFAFGQPDSCGQLGDDLLVRRAGDECAIQLLDAVARMSEPVCQFAVVGQDHQSRAVLIKPADGVNSFGNFGEEIDDARPTCGVEVCRDVALRLIHGEVDHRLEADRFAVDSDARTGGVDPSAELADDFSVDRNAPLFDQIFAASARAETGVRQHFLNPLALRLPRAAVRPRPRFVSVSILMSELF